MKLLKYTYEKISGKRAPYYYNYSILTILAKPIRKWLAQVVAPNCVFNNIRILLYRLCGFKIGKHVFIGMHCYLDDLCYDKLTTGNNVTISYGTYFACHGRHQDHYPITIKDGTYIGMKASIISKNVEGDDTPEGVVIGNNAIIGACALVNCNVPDGATAVGVPCRIIKKESGI